MRRCGVGFVAVVSLLDAQIDYTRMRPVYKAAMSSLKWSVHANGPDFLAIVAKLRAFSRSIVTSAHPAGEQRGTQIELAEWIAEVHLADFFDAT